jgi:hypothetical protein
MLTMKMPGKRATLLMCTSVALTALLAAGSDTYADIVVDGSFESPAAPPGGGLPATIPTGWSALGNGSSTGIIANGNGFGAMAADGNQFVDLIDNTSGIFPSGLTQNVTLDAGQTYTLSFAYNGDGGNTFRPNILDYSLGSLLSGSVDATSLNAIPAFGPTTPWQTVSIQFSVGTTGSYPLTFETPAGLLQAPFVDDVQITPVPSTAWVAGLSLIGIRRRRRAHAKATA